MGIRSFKKEIRLVFGEPPEAPPKGRGYKNRVPVWRHNLPDEKSL